MSDYRPDDVVDITIKGVRIVGEVPGGSVTIADEHGDHFDMPPQAAVERCAPTGWPPEPGDLWRDRDGDLWFARHLGGSQVSLAPHDGTKDGRDPWWVSGRFGPLTRVYREDGAPCGCDRHGDHAGCDANCECAP